SGRALAARGLRACGRLGVPVDALERLDELLRVSRRPDGSGLLSDQARESLGWSADEAAAILKALGYVRGKGEAEGRWKATRPARPAGQAKPPRHSPFAALAALNAPPAPAEQRRRRRPRRKPRAAAGAPS
ncbi:MAG TPA: phosphonate-binding protein, partial [Caulobacteraceae bacterium]|nr:phosphonate-binding protein [Caulobacteraceae bacterium]